MIYERDPKSHARYINLPTHKGQPQHRELHPLSEQCVGSLTSDMEIINMEAMCETGPTVYSSYLPICWCNYLSICWCNYKGSTFSLVLLRPWVLVRSESNSRPPAWQPDAQPTEPPVRGLKHDEFSVDDPREDRAMKTSFSSPFKDTNFVH